MVWGQFSQVVAAGSDFLTLDVEQLISILSSDKLCVESEEEVFHAVIKWVKHEEVTPHHRPRASSASSFRVPPIISLTKETRRGLRLTSLLVILHSRESRSCPSSSPWFACL